ncbi:hypothetical protein PCE1_002273 [Barthelona sp. PCE]
MSGTNSIKARRILLDIFDLQKGGFTILTQSTKKVKCEFQGPDETPYENAIFHIEVSFSDNYPLTSPSVSFVEHIPYHPNVSESGSICLDVINSNWQASFTIRNILDDFLPWLMRYPNADDPLRSAAARDYKEGKERWQEIVRNRITKFVAKKEEEGKEEEVNMNPILTSGNQKEEDEEEDLYYETEEEDNLVKNCIETDEEKYAEYEDEEDTLFSDVE